MVKHFSSPPRYLLVTFPGWWSYHKDAQNALKEAAADTEQIKLYMLLYKKEYGDTRSKIMCERSAPCLIFGTWINGDGKLDMMGSE